MENMETFNRLPSDLVSAVPLWWTCRFRAASATAEGICLLKVARHDRSNGLWRFSLSSWRPVRSRESMDVVAGVETFAPVRTSVEILDPWRSHHMRSNNEGKPTSEK